MSGRAIVITNQKGGVGKTTSAVHIAAGIHSMGKRVCLLEADWGQGSASMWASINGGLGFDVISEQIRGAELAERVVELCETYEYVIVDGVPSADRESLIGLLGVADFALAPTQPAPLDIWSTEDFCVKVKAEVSDVNPDLKMAIFLNKANPSRKKLLAVTEMMILAPNRAVPVLKARIGDRNPFAAVPAVGKTVLDLGGKEYELARTEVMAVVKETLALMEGN